MKRCIFFALLLVTNNIQAETEPIHVQILAFNDFHGNLLPPSGNSGKINGEPSGGIQFLATHLKILRQNHPFSITVSAGDLFGASPILSALFNEKPTVDAMNLLGLDISAIGNHEFDKGYQPLLKLLEGDCLGNDCGEDKFKGAQFSVLAANVLLNQSGKTLFKPYEIRQFGPIKIAFVGLVLRGVDQLVMAEKIEGLTFLPEAKAVNDLIPELTSLGVNTVVVLIHEGGYSQGGFNDCPSISGPIVDIAHELHDHVSVIVSGHTHEAYNCRIGKKLVTSAASYGRLVTNINLAMDPVKNQLIFASADNIIVTRDVLEDENQTKIIDRYQKIAASIANRVVGNIMEDLVKAVNDAGESLLGKMIADAQLLASKRVALGQADVAMVNPGGIRTDLSYLSSNVMEGHGNVTYGEAYAVQPFNNVLITKSFTGAEIIEVLEQQFAGCGFDQTRILQVSRGFSYSYRSQEKPCEKIDRASVMINGERLKMEKTYRVVTNNFLGDGGDGFSAFKKGRSPTVVGLDIEALEAYLLSSSPVHADRNPRILRPNQSFAQE